MMHRHDEDEPETGPAEVVFRLDIETDDETGEEVRRGEWVLVGDGSGEVFWVEREGLKEEVEVLPAGDSKERQYSDWCQRWGLPEGEEPEEEARWILYGDSGREIGRYRSVRDAEVAAAQEWGPEAVIGHPGDLADGGNRTLIWADEESAENDAGLYAVGEIRPEENPRGSESNPRGSEIQSVAFPKAEWTPTTAREWLRKHGYKAPAVDETDNYLRYRQRPPGSFKRFVTKPIVVGSKTINLILGFHTTRAPRRR